VHLEDSVPIRVVLPLGKRLIVARQVGSGHKLAGKHATHVLDIALRNSIDFINNCLLKC
jgi:hypothetical protein